MNYMNNYEFQMERIKLSLTIHFWLETRHNFYNNYCKSIEPHTATNVQQNYFWIVSRTFLHSISWHATSIFKCLMPSQTHFNPFVRLNNMFFISFVIHQSALERRRRHICEIIYKEETQLKTWFESVIHLAFYLNHVLN